MRTSNNSSLSAKDHLILFCHENLNITFAFCIYYNNICVIWILFMYLSRIRSSSDTRIHYGHVWCCMLIFYCAQYVICEQRRKQGIGARCDGAQQKSIHVRLVHNNKRFIFCFAFIFLDFICTRTSCWNAWWLVMYVMYRFAVTGDWLIYSSLS